MFADKRWQSSAVSGINLINLRRPQRQPAPTPSLKVNRSSSLPSRIVASGLFQAAIYYKAFNFARKEHVSDAAE
jgi:hypothetical protein